MSPTVRTLLKHPGFSGTIVVTLGLGLGLATAILSLLHEVWFRPLPYPDGDRLVVVWARNVARGWNIASASLPELRELGERTTAFEVVSPFLSDRDFVVLGDGPARTAETTFVDHGHLSALGARLQAGRFFTPDEARPNSGAEVVIVQDAFWRSRLGGRPDVLGATIRLNDRPFTIIGILAPGYRDVVDRWHRSEVFAPLGVAHLLYGDDIYTTREGREFNAVAVRRAGTSPERANDEAAGLARRLQREHPVAHDGFDFRLMPVREFLFGEVELLARALAAGAALVLVITLVNLGYLFLARAESRRGEFAIRTALGAGASGLVRESLAEAVILCAAGGTLALAIGSSLTALFAHDHLRQLPVFTEVRLGHGNAAAALALVTLGAVAFAVLPALRARRADLGEALRRTDRIAGDRGGRGRRHAFLATQSGFAVVLVAGTLLTALSLANLRDRELGYDPDRLLTASFSADRDRYPDRAALRRLNERLHARLQALPGIGSATLWGPMPPGRTWYNIAATPARLDPGVEANQTILRRIHVTPGGFRNLGIPLVRGRDFGPVPPPDGPVEIVLSERAARRFWPGADPVGQLVHLEGRRESPAIVVGVAASVRQNGRLHDESSSAGDLYLSAFSHPQTQSSVVVRMRVDSGAAVRELRAAFADVDPAIALADVATLDERLRDEAGGHRLAATLFTIFGSLATFLATLGVYGVLSFSTARRTREFGIRLAVGATAAHLATLTLRQGLASVGLGALAGSLLASHLAGFIAAFLVDTTPANPLAIAGAALAVLLAGLAAGLPPALRAARTDPLVALRTD